MCMILSTQSEAVQKAAYECQWYQHSKLMKHYLLMIMARSQKAVQINAYQLYIISLQSYGKVQSNTKKYSTCQTLSTDLCIVLKTKQVGLHSKASDLYLGGLAHILAGTQTTMRLNKVFLSPCRQMTGWCSKFGHNCFLPH